MMKGKIKMPSTINFSVETTSASTIPIESDSIPISELKHILEIYPHIKSSKMRCFILGFINAAAWAEYPALAEKILKLDIEDYKANRQF